MLPRQLFGVALYYLVYSAGLLCAGQESNGLAPWLMEASFGIGQLLIAGILYWYLERTDECCQEA